MPLGALSSHILRLLWKTAFITVSAGFLRRISSRYLCDLREGNPSHRRVAGEVDLFRFFQIEDGNHRMGVHHQFSPSAAPSIIRLRKVKGPKAAHTAAVLRAIIQGSILVYNRSIRFKRGDKNLRSDF